MDQHNKPFDWTKAEFDTFAPDYDSIAADKQKYKAHEMVASSLARHAAPGIQHIIDLGTGTGLLIPHLSEQFKKAVITGADLSENMMKEAIDKGLQATFIQADLREEMWAFEDGKYQAAVSAGVLEFIQDSGNFIKNTSRLLDNDGLAVLTYQHPANGKTPVGAAPTYSHLPRNIEDQFAAAGMTIIEHDRFEAYRYGGGQPVFYGLVTARKYDCV